MKKVVLGAFVAALALTTVPAFALDSLTLQVKWTTQAQFGGYYVAKDKGFYKDAGLDVTIKPGGPDLAPETVIAAGGADVIVDWMSAALAAREKGVMLVNIAQPFAKAGLEMICPKYTGIKSPADFKGKTIGVWFFGNELPFFAWMHKEGIPVDGGPDGITVLKQGYDVQALIQKQASCIHVMTYNEYGQALDAGFKPEDLTVFNYSAMGNDLLEDGLYVLQDQLKDPAFKDKIVRFVKASMKGWDYALAHPEESAQIVVDNGGPDYKHQLYMMGEVAKLTAGGNGVLDEAAYERTAAAVLAQGIITKKPEGAWTHEITDAAGLGKM